MIKYLANLGKKVAPYMAAAALIAGCNSNKCDEGNPIVIYTNSNKSFASTAPMNGSSTVTTALGNTLELYVCPEDVRGTVKGKNGDLGEIQYPTFWNKNWISRSPEAKLEDSLQDAIKNALR